MRSVISGIQIPTDSRINIDGGLTLDSLAGTSGQVLTSQGAGVTPIWTTVSGGGSGFTGAGTSVTGVAGTNVNGGVGNITGSDVIVATGTAITTLSVIGATAKSGNLYVRSGYAEGSVAQPGNVYVETGSYAYDSEDGSGSGGNVLIGSGYTSAVGIGLTDTSGNNLGSPTVNILDKSSSIFSKILNLATNGGNSTVNIATGATTPLVKIGANSTSSATYHFGKNFFWQPTPAAVTAGTAITVANLQTWILTTTSTSGNLQLPTPANMDTITSVSTDIGFDWVLINTAASGSVTITANGSHTVVGNMAVSFGTSARFRSRRSAATPTWVTYRIG